MPQAGLRRIVALTKADCLFPKINMGQLSKDRAVPSRRGFAEPCVYEHEMSGAPQSLLHACPWEDNSPCCMLAPGKLTSQASGVNAARLSTGGNVRCKYMLPCL